MADLQTSLRDNLIGAGLNPDNPTSTYTDFAARIAKNQQDQAEQEQALELAKQHVAQAKLQTKQGQEADDAGLNPLLGDYMSPEQAVSTVRLILKEKGLPIDENELASWQKTLPAQVNRQIVGEFANRLSGDRTRAGQAVKLDEDFPIKIAEGKSAADLGLENMKDGQGNPVDDKTKSDGTFTAYVPAAGMYSLIYNNRSEVEKVIPAGKEPADQSLKFQAHDEDINRKEWRALNAQIDSAFKNRSGGLGSVITSIYRADRAFNTLQSDAKLTAQDLANVSQDIAGIYQGGAPTVVSAKENSYDTLFAHLADTVRRYTGVLLDPGATSADTRSKLLQVLSDLRTSALDNFKKWMDSEAAGYAAVISSNPPQWTSMKELKMAAVTSGLLDSLTPAEKQQLNAKPSDLTGLNKTPSAGASTGKKVPKYTVIEDGK